MLKLETIDRDPTRSAAICYRTCSRNTVRKKGEMVWNNSTPYGEVLLDVFPVSGVGSLGRFGVAEQARRNLDHLTALDFGEELLGFRILIGSCWIDPSFTGELAVLQIGIEHITNLERRGHLKPFAISHYMRVVNGERSTVPCSWELAKFLCEG
jgi:hypothetical protein